MPNRRTTVASISEKRRMKTNEYIFVRHACLVSESLEQVLEAIDQIGFSVETPIDLKGTNLRGPWKEWEAIAKECREQSLYVQKRLDELLGMFVRWRFGAPQEFWRRVDQYRAAW